MPRALWPKVSQLALLSRAMVLPALTCKRVNLPVEQEPVKLQVVTLEETRLLKLARLAEKSEQVDSQISVHKSWEIEIL